MALINIVRRARDVVAGILGSTMLLCATGQAAGPRWTAGSPYFWFQGSSVAWYTTQPQYFTDPGDLSAYVNHAAADALVASAAATWNNSMSSMVLAQGGALNEHVSSANVYLGQSGPVFPADVQASNYTAKQIAVIYDSDGSVTDTLLGGGASDPSNCRQSAVTESVDYIHPNNQILHAIIVLNGRCTGSAAALQMEMKYRLVRAFGRVLGLGWSQLNDNVFTGTPQPTSQQALNWPLMHPIDVLCGPYAYQCMQQPFTLRTDDLASLISLYPVTSAGNGKTLSYANAGKFQGYVSFPNGQGMEGLLVSLRRFHFGPGYSDAFDVVSSTTGYNFQQTGGNPVTPKGSTQAASYGSTNASQEGYYYIGWLPIPSTDYFDNVTATTSAINPLYTGQYSVGPYTISQVTPSGPAMTNTVSVYNPQFGGEADMTSTGAPSSCGSGGDGTESAPLSVAASGLWFDTLCGYQHTAWSSLAVKAGRSLTMEVTAVDEQGYSTAGKMLPVIGVWDSGDPTGSQPTLASQAAALNASSLGMTNLRVASSTARTMRISVSDQRGDGRPDFGYNGRVLYADAISPASLPANGGMVTISGMGFRAGNTVTVNGITTTVNNWTANTITLVAPAITGPLAVDVVVTDLSTGGQTTMSGALSYTQNALPDVLTVVSKPANGGYVGAVGAPVFKVQVMLPDGATPAAGAVVTFASTMATFGACSAASTCVLTADASGLVSSAVTPTAAGSVTLTASVGAASISTSFVALAVPVDQLSVVSMPSGTVYATLPATSPFSVKVLLPDGVTPAAGVNVVVTASNAALGGCSGASTCTLTANVSGVISTTVTPAAAGVVSLLASAGGGMVSASFGATMLPADMLRVVSKPADGSYVGRMAAIPFAVQVLLGDNATPAAGAAVTVSASGGTLAACGGTTCVLTADSTGSISSAVTPTAAGTVGLMASAGGGTVATSFSAVVVPPDSLVAVFKPANGSYVARVAATSFAVQVRLGDTGAPAAGVSVSVAATNAVLGACGGSSCTLTADATGTVTTTVSPTTAGTVTLTASAGGGTLSVSFVAANVPPDTLNVLSKPANGSYVGRAAALPFTVQTIAGDTGAQAAGIAVTVTAMGGTLAGCGGTASCVLTADATGMISTGVTPSSVGTVTLSASAGGGSVTASFNAVAVPPDVLHVVSQPLSGSYVGRTAALPFAVQVALGDTGGAAAGVGVNLSATNGILNACGASLCVLTADSTGSVSTTVTPSAVGLVSLSASAGGGSVSASFNAVAVPPDVLHVVTQPANGSFANRVSATPFSVQVALGDTGGPAMGVSVSISATNAVLNACGVATCTLTADVTGTVSTTVTPLAVGPVGLTANAGGGTVSVSFTSVAIPSDSLIVVTRPADGSYAGRAATLPFAVKTIVGETGAPAAGASISVSATGATFAACGGMSFCTLTADSTGTISTAVTPTVPGTVSLSASEGGGTASVFFNAVAVPPDVLTVVSKPANGAYVGRAAVIPFVAQVALGDTGGPAAGVSVSVSATNGMLSACGASTCTMAADSTGTISTTVTPSAVGTVGLTASAGGGTISTSFTAVAVPPDSLVVVSKPADGSYVGRRAALPFTVQVSLGDGSGPAAGISVIVAATNGTLAACGGSPCALTADASGTISTAVTPSATGTVSLTASADGGSVTVSFNAAAVPPDTIHLVSQPANGSYAGRAAVLPFTVQISLGDTGGPASGVSATIAAVNATIGACGAASCTITADTIGSVSTSVTPTSAGVVAISVSAGGGTASASFNAVAVPPDTLHVLTQPTNGSYAGAPATVAFSVQTLLGDTGAPANGASITLTSTNATLGCGGATCTLAAGITGAVSTTVTPTAPGMVGLSASAGGGTVSTSFSAVAMPPDTLQVISSPTSGSYVGSPAVLPFAVSVLLGDGVTPASGVPVVVTAVGGTLGACGLSTCTLTANVLGAISTNVTATTPGVVTLTATAGGGTVSASFTADAVPDTLQVLSTPSDHTLVNQVAATPFSVQVFLGALTNSRLKGQTAYRAGPLPGAGETVTLTAVGAKLNACGLPACVMTADSTGTVSSMVTPILPGPITLLASAAGGTASAVFAADTPPDTVQVTSVPANGSYANRVAGTPFAVQVLLGGGSTPAGGVSVTLTAAGGTLGVCGLSTCVVSADAGGNVSTAVTPAGAGLVQLTASAGGGTASASFTSAAVPPDTLHVVAQPANGSYVGRVAATPFTVQAVLGDTGSPASGASVTVSAVNATLSACGLATCVLVADSNGTVSTSLTPTAVGTVQLSASAGGGTISASFSVVAVPPDSLQVTSQPANGAYAGRVAASAFAVQVLRGDTGAAVAAGVSVTITASDATLGACGLATCVLTTDSTGTVSTMVTPSAPGTVGLTAAAGGGSVSASFTAAAVPPDALHVVSQPANGSYVARVASIPFKVQVLLGDTGGAAVGASVTVTVAGGTFGACGLTTCVLTADSMGSVSTSVTPSAAGSVQLTAMAGGGSVSASFNATAVPPDSLQVVSQPADGSYAGSAAAARFAVQAMLGDTGAPAAGVSVTIAASNATLGVCGSGTCVLTADPNGTVSTTVTPLSAGAVSMTATAGGGTVSASFYASPAPVDVLHIVSQPSGTVYSGVPAASAFAVQVMLPDGRTPASGAAVTVTAIHAALMSCGGASSCVLTADSGGLVSTIVTPQQAGVFSLQAAAGGGTISTSITALTLPADILSVVSAPVSPIYVGVTAATRFVVHVLLGDGVTPAAGALVTLTAQGASFGACGSACVLTADASGDVSTMVTPSVAGNVMLTASAGGGMVSSSFTVTPDVLRILSIPASGSYTGSAAALPFAVQVLLGDGLTPAAAATVTVSAAGGTLGACALTPCTLTADGQGAISTAVTATASGTVTLTASAGGGVASSSFTATAPPDVLTVLSSPANGTFLGRSSSASFTVQVSHGNATNRVLTPNTALPLASGVAVTLTSSGATLDACGLTSCTLTTDVTGTVSTTVTPTTVGMVTLSANGGGGTASSSFTAAALPDVLRVTSVPAGGSYFGRIASAPFAVQVFLEDGVTPASGTSVTVTASRATLGACGQMVCILSTDAMGMVSTTVTPSSAGTVNLTASGGGGLISASFTAGTPPDLLHVTSTPANGAFTGRAATLPFTVQVLLGDGVTSASGAVVMLTASNAIFGACGLSNCSVPADANGMLSTTVSPIAAGVVSLQASAAGGSASSSFTAVDPVRVISISRVTEYVATGATVAWMPVVTLLENGVPAPSVAVTWYAAQGISFAEPDSTTDASGRAAMGVTIGPLVSGATPTGQACAWGNVCASFGAQAVDPANWRLAIVNGGDQNVVATGTLQTMTLRATDDAGDWIAGVPMQVNQLARGWVVCPPTGRCPVGPVLASANTSVVSDIDGLVVVTPLQITNTAETTGVVAVAGPNGYVSVSLSKVP